MSDAFAPDVVTAIEKRDDATLWSYLTRVHPQPLSHHAERLYRRALRRWFGHCEAAGVSPVTPPPGEDQRHADAMLRAGLNGATAVELSALGTWFRTFAAYGLVNRPFSVVSTAQHTPNDRGDYTRRDIERLTQHADWGMRALIYWMVDHGRRQHELYDLMWRDVVEEHSVFVSGVRVALSPRFMATIEEGPHRTGPVMPFRSNTRATRKMRRLCEKASVRYRGVDTLRRLHS